MSLVKFAVICDQCGTRGPEYGPTYHCVNCLDDVCEKCMPDADPETARGVCKYCEETCDDFDERELDSPRAGQAAGLNREGRRE